MYRSAKRLYRTFKPARQTAYKGMEFYYIYRTGCTKNEEIRRILAHYDSCKKTLSHLVIVVEGHVSSMHELMGRWPGVTFLSADYYKTYQKKLSVRNMICLDHTRKPPEILEWM